MNQIDRLTKTAVRMAMDADQKKGLRKDFDLVPVYTRDLKPYVIQLLKDGINPIHVPRKAFNQCYGSLNHVPR